MLWAVIGNSGLLGSDIEKTLVASGEHAIGFNRTNLNLDLPAKEISSQILDLAVGQGSEKPAVVVNAVGYTDVDQAESNPEEVQRVNVEYAQKLAEVAKHLGSRFVHISTDFVFDGNTNAPYETTDLPNPESKYGKSKFSGEIAVQESGADYQIFRTAWLYGENGHCFPRTVAKILNEKGRMSVVDDQIGQPTWAKDLAELIIGHQKKDSRTRPRIVHATSSGSCSWYEFASEVALSLGYDPREAIFPISTEDYPTPAKRPAYSALNNKNETGLVIGDWRERWRLAAELVLAEQIK